MPYGVAGVPMSGAFVPHGGVRLLQAQANPCIPQSSHLGTEAFPRELKHLQNTLTSFLGTHAPLFGKQIQAGRSQASLLGAQPFPWGNLLRHSEISTGHPSTSFEFPSVSPRTGIRTSWMTRAFCNSTEASSWSTQGNLWHTQPFLIASFFTFFPT